MTEEDERALQVVERMGLKDNDLDEAQDQLMLQQTLPGFRAIGAGEQPRQVAGQSKQRLGRTRRKETAQSSRKVRNRLLLVERSRDARTSFCS